MQRFIRYATYLAGAAQLVVTASLFPETYGKGVFILLLMAVLPILTIIALYTGPDLEETRLLKQVRKARLQDELKKLGGGESRKKD